MLGGGLVAGCIAVSVRPPRCLQIGRRLRLVRIYERVGSLVRRSHHVTWDFSELDIPPSMKVEAAMRAIGAPEVAVLSPSIAR